MKLLPALILALTASSLLGAGKQVSETGIKHSFLITGSLTAIIGEDDKVTWTVPGDSRDGAVLENGNILITSYKEVREYKKGTTEVVWSYKLDPRNKELATASRLPDGNTMIVECGNVPRLIEVDQAGEVKIEVALKPEIKDAHKQTRMARKLPSGNYLVPHLLAFKVKEYAPDGKVVREIKTDLEELGGRKARNWPFTAIVLPNNNVLVNLTNGDKTVEFDPEGKVVWNCGKAEAKDHFRDPCGGQRLANGNTVICSFGHNKPKLVKVFEVSADKKVVWEYTDPAVRAHQIHILSTNGKPETTSLR